MRKFGLSPAASCAGCAARARPTCWFLSTVRSAGYYAIAGFPALTVPGGYRKAGKPFGLTFVGQPFEDGRLIAAAYAFEQAAQARSCAPVILGNSKKIPLDRSEFCPIIPFQHVQTTSVTAYPPPDGSVSPGGFVFSPRFRPHPGKHFSGMFFYFWFFFPVSFPERGFFLSGSRRVPPWGPWPFGRRCHAQTSRSD